LVSVHADVIRKEKVVCLGVVPGAEIEYARPVLEGERFGPYLDGHIACDTPTVQKSRGKLHIICVGAGAAGKAKHSVRPGKICIGANHYDCASGRTHRIGKVGSCPFTKAPSVDNPGV